jgi:hypothetical protein
MKKLWLLLGLLLTVNFVSAQTFTPDITKGRVKYSEKKLKTLYLDSTYSRFRIEPDITVSMDIRTPALQLTFTQVEKINGEYKLTTPIYIGYSYIFSAANGVIHQDSSITIENKFFFGGGINFGVTPDLANGGQLIGSVPVGAIVGYSKYGAFAGYDIINKRPLFGVSINLLNVPVLQNLTRFTLK